MDELRSSDPFGPDLGTKRSGNVATLAGVAEAYASARFRCTPMRPRSSVKGSPAGVTCPLISGLQPTNAVVRVASVCCWFDRSGALR